MSMPSSSSHEECKKRDDQLYLELLTQKYQIRVNQIMTQAAVDSLTALSDKIDFIMSVLSYVAAGNVSKDEIRPYLTKAQKAANDKCMSKLNAIMRKADKGIETLKDQLMNGAL